MSHPTARTRLRGSATRAAAALLAGTVAGTLVLTATATPAQAATRPSPYGFAAEGYGTLVTASAAELRSAKTAYSVIGCTKLTGLTHANHVAATTLTPAVKVGAITTAQTSRLTSSGTSVVQSTTTVASVTLGTNTLGIRITGLRGQSTAYATKGGSLRAGSTFTFSSLTPLGSTPLPPPLNQPLDVLLGQLAKQGPVTIPGLGVVQLGRVARTTSSASASSGSMGLRVHLFGTDRANGGGDDSDVVIGRSYARVTKAATKGVLAGYAAGVDATALNGVLTVGKNPLTPLRCEGTFGRVLGDSLAGLNVPGAVAVGALNTRTYGKQNSPTGGLTGWTEANVASVTLGGGALRVSGITARAKVVRYRSGRLVKVAFQDLGTLTVNGTVRRAPSPGQSLTVPGVAKIEVPLPVAVNGGVRVTGLRITLLGGTAANTVVNLATAEARTRRR